MLGATSGCVLAVFCTSCGLLHQLRPRRQQFKSAAGATLRPSAPGAADHLNPLVLGFLGTLWSLARLLRRRTRFLRQLRLRRLWRCRAPASAAAWARLGRGRGLGRRLHRRLLRGARAILLRGRRRLGLAVAWSCRPRLKVARAGRRPCPCPCPARCRGASISGGRLTRDFCLQRNRSCSVDLDEAADALELLGKEIGLRPLRALRHVRLDPGPLQLPVLVHELGTALGIERRRARPTSSRSESSEEEQDSAHGHRYEVGSLLQIGDHMRRVLHERSAACQTRH